MGFHLYFSRFQSVPEVFQGCYKGLQEISGVPGNLGDFQWVSMDGHFRIFQEALGLCQCIPGAKSQECSRGFLVRSRGFLEYSRGSMGIPECIERV